MPAMPPTPPSSFDQLPYHADGGRQTFHHAQPHRSMRDGRKAVNSSVHHCAGAMDALTDDAQLFEVSTQADPTMFKASSALAQHALWEIRRNQQTYRIDDTRTCNLEIRTKPRKDTVLPKTQAIKKRSSRASNARATNKAVRPPALCATHPSLFKAPSTPKHQTQTMLPTLPPETRNGIKSKPDPKSMQPPTRRVPASPWKVYTDPNKLLSAEPQFDDPMYRMLKMDVNPDQPKVVSPLYMIGMPCGSLLEAANYYGDDDMPA